MPQGKKVAIGFQSYDLTRIANIRVADMVLAEAAFPGCGIERTMPFFLEKPPHQLSIFRTTQGFSVQLSYLNHFEISLLSLCNLPRPGILTMTEASILKGRVTLSL
ncbi:unnamed protein product [Withania somnifera]